MLSQYQAVLDQSPSLSREAEQALFARYHQGDEEAQEILFRHNLRLVLSIAKAFVGRADFDELFQEGQLGLLKALRLFQPDRGLKFSTYATSSIRRAIQRFLRKNMIVHGPLNGFQPDHKRPVTYAMEDPEVFEGVTDPKIADQYLITEFCEAQLSTLPINCKRALGHYYGLPGYTYLPTHAQVATHLGYSKEYVQVCLRKGLNMLRYRLTNVRRNGFVRKRD